MNKIPEFRFDDIFNPSNIKQYIDSEKECLEISVPINDGFREVYEKFIDVNFNGVPAISESEFYGLILTMTRRWLFKNYLKD
jgi:hypothetical protein